MIILFCSLVIIFVEKYDINDYSLHYEEYNNVFFISFFNLK